MKETFEDIIKEFKDKFVVQQSEDEHAIVGFYNEDDNCFEYWNDYTVINFIKSKLEEVHNNALKMIEEGLPEEDFDAKYYKDTPNLDEVSYGIGKNCLREEIINNIQKLKI